MYSHSVSSEETDPPPDYTSTDKLCVTGATSTSSVSCETSSTRLRTTSDGSASFHHRPPRLSNAQRQSTFPPMNVRALTTQLHAANNYGFFIFRNHQRSLLLLKLKLILQNQTTQEEQQQNFQMLQILFLVV